MVISRRSLLLAGAAIPTAAYGQCVTDVLTVDACRGGVRGSSGPPGRTLDLNFMFPGSMPPGITFTRASSATYTDASGVVQTAATNAPRWDYAGGVLRGVLIEEQRTNLMLRSGDLSAAPWSEFHNTGSPPVITGNNAVAPDGTTTAARVVFPAVSAASNYAIVSQAFTGAVAAFTFSVWLKGSVGGEQIYLLTTPNGTLFFRSRVTLTTAWQRFSVTASALDGNQWFFQIGTDLRDTSQTATTGGTVYMWGADVQQGAFPTSYIPTTSVSVTRAADSMSMSPAALFSGVTAGTFNVEAIMSAANNANYCALFSANDGTTNNRMQMYQVGNTNNISCLTVAASVGSGAPVFGAMTPGTAFKAAMTHRSAGFTTAFNGVTGPTDATPSPNPAILTAFTLGNGLGLAPMTGYWRRLTYWNRALSDTEMQQVTT